MNITELLKLTAEKKASDLHLNVGVPPTLRINGQIVHTEYPVLTPETSKALVEQTLNEKQKKKFKVQKEVDYAITLKGVARFRVNAFLERRGVAAAFRIIDAKIPDLSKLNLPPSIEGFAALEKGIILVTGPTGSGKSSTLAAIIDIVNTNESKHIITLEDPIEFIHPPHNCIISQREIGKHSHSFSSALKAAMREDPDVILVGEMRDLETIELAIRAAETGHLVFSTLHTISAPKTIDRIVGVFPKEQQAQVRLQIAESLKGVISQVLIPTIDNLSRVPAVEIMTSTPAIRNLIREGKTPQLYSTIQLNAQEGMQTLDQSLAKLVRHGKINREYAFKYAQNPKEIKHLLESSAYKKVKK